jgi:hypothetical protein
MATAETVQLSEPHAPKEASIKTFEDVLPTLKQELVKLRRDHDSKYHQSADHTSNTTQHTKKS